jgi:uncharacterized protein YecT (DUF1311 family)
MKSFWGSILTMLILGSGCGAGAQTKRAEQIEAQLKKELDAPNGETTQGMVEACDRATQAYAMEIRRVYDKLMKGLPKPERTALQASQKAWLEYLDRQRLVTSYIYDAPGTIHRVAGVMSLMDVLKARLRGICDLFLVPDENGEFTEEVPTQEYWCGETHERLTGSDPLAVLFNERPRRKAKKSP